jgi:hypothetical protein
MDDFEREAEAEQRRLVLKALASLTPEQKAAIGVPDGLGVEAPGGWKLKATGSPVIAVILVVVAVFLIVAALHKHDADAASHSAMIKGEVGTVRQEVHTLSDRIEETTYVLTLSDDERKKLKLDMPESLRKRTGRDPR